MIELHEIEHGMPLTVHAISIACVEAIADKNGNEIGTMIAISGISDSWVSVVEPYETVVEMIERAAYGWEPVVKGEN